MDGVEDTGSVFDATETPLADVLRYGVTYPLVPVLAAVGVSTTDVSVASRSARVVAAVGLLAVMVVACLAALWVIRPSERTEMDMAAPGVAVRDEGAERTDALTGDAGQRFRVLAFGVGTALWGVCGLVAMFLALPA